MPQRHSVKYRKKSVSQRESGKYGYKAHMANQHLCALCSMYSEKICCKTAA